MFHILFKLLVLYFLKVNNIRELQNNYNKVSIITYLYYIQKEVLQQGQKNDYPRHCLTFCKAPRGYKVLVSHKTITVGVPHFPIIQRSVEQGGANMSNDQTSQGRVLVVTGG